MPVLSSLVFPGLGGDGIAILLGATLIGGVVRGFTGFGFAMVFMPLASVVLGPVAALGLIWFVDLPFALPIAARAARRAEWSEIVPLLLTATLALPAGVWLLTWLDRDTMRWLLAGLILAAVGLMASGWRYHGRPGVPLSLGVGALSGLCNGMASIGGMPLAVFWLGAQRNDHHRTRANMQAFFGVSTVLSGVVLFWKGILTGQALLTAIPLVVIYGLGLWAGSRGYRIASEASFRRGAYAVIFASAVTSLPLWDTLIGR